MKPRNWKLATRRLLGVAAAGAVAVALVVATPGLTPQASAAVNSVAPLVGLVPTPSNKGYWQVAADGGVFAFGDAPFYGSMGGQPLSKPVVGMAASPTGRGYWLAAADGGVFAFGDAPFKGSMGGRPLNNPVAGMAATPSGQGYWLAAADGGVFAFGDAPFKGSMAGQALAGAVNAIARTSDGGGYWLSAVDGGVFAYGNATFCGRATYTPPKPPALTAAQKAANLAIGWEKRDWTGINYDYWNAPYPPEYWCVDFLTYTWQHAGINIPHYVNVTQLTTWGRNNGRWSTDYAHPRIGDAVVYASHAGIVVQINANGSVVSIDGDWGGTPGTQATFAKSSHVVMNTWNPSGGYGAAGRITGYVRAG
jgi:hypothetical protein